MTQKNDLIGIFGGTFDPVHNGHLRVALEAIEQVRLREVRFVPNHRPSHRAAPVATVTERLRMLHLAIKPPLCIDDSEVKRGGVSYMVETLELLREKHPSTALCLILGRDAFENLSTWYRADAVLKLAHVIVASRGGLGLRQREDVVEGFVGGRYCKDAMDLRKTASGRVFLMDIPLLPISSSDLRDRLGRGLSVRHLVPESIETFITKIYAKEQ